MIPHASVSSNDPVLIIVLIAHQLFGRLTHENPITPSRASEEQNQWKTLQQTEVKLFTLLTCSDGAGLVLPRMDSWGWMWLETPKESLEWVQAHGQTVWTSLVWRLCGQHAWIPSCRVSVARCRRHRGTAPLSDQFLNEEVSAPSNPLLISAWRDNASAWNVICHC